MSKSLWELKSGESCTISTYGEELDKDYQNRLKDLGFHPGQEIECIQSTKLGAPKIFKLNNSIYALDDQVAKEVICE
jgi:Fe2+ transport system protein FeoA